MLVYAYGSYPIPNQHTLTVGHLAQGVHCTVTVAISGFGCCLHCTDHRLLHFSWLGVVFKRIFVHDAKVIIKWGVRSCLDMELEGSPILNRENWGVSES